MTDDIEEQAGDAVPKDTAPTDTDDQDEREAVLDEGIEALEALKPEEGKP